MEGDIPEVDSITSVRSSDKEENNNNLQAETSEMACTSSARTESSQEFQITEREIFHLQQHFN